ncbi:MAG: repressor LexA [Candidatus Portnoybacteria bacterium CG02_land_8_20_14_3_00_45_8]|uniref:Repressor LexA n=1 Tax=Candidatus Portnoybacteria bacterium CG02_land_8_20_14_3_00_45_8 TaxID=1974807 RepID=A0A2M7D665_9BACT|nr:MAG: repressor LexA [Candidatus Portnoybacteria bacterium CG02_land_8_20_14_3_00_45_8]
MRENVTEKQKNILEAIYNSMNSFGMPPTLAELRQYIGVQSNQVILDILEVLEKKGLIKREAGKIKRKTRKITILPLGFQILEKEQKIPLLGVSSASPFIESLDTSINWFSLPSTSLENKKVMQSKEEFFAIQVQGDSMINVGINDGDRLLVKKTNEFRSGDIVVARCDDGTTVKRFIAESDGRAYLRPENPAYDNMPIYEEMIFEGKVILNLSQIK